MPDDMMHNLVHNLTSNLTGGIGVINLPTVKAAPTQ